MQAKKIKGVWKSYGHPYRTVWKHYVCWEILTLQSHAILDMAFDLWRNQAQTPNEMRGISMINKHT